jgi:2-keto-4-pentenoate hydratase/2-oxohepta-3-ene-1,7-dioic acid hydratase in catechol pathway
MRCVVFRRDGESRPGVLRDEQVIDLPLLLEWLGLPAMPAASLRAFIEAGEDVWRAVQAGIAPSAIDALSRQGGVWPLDAVTLDAPLRDTHKLILLAGNYREHIREVGYRVPTAPETVTPQFFMKPPSTTIIAPGEPVVIHKVNTWVDWEVELAVVICKRGRYIAPEQAMDYVFGYTIVNDISERAFNADFPNRFVREKDPLFDWLHGKWFDGFAPMGPVVVTADEVEDPHNLAITLSVNGKVEQDSNTSYMLHRIPHLIHKLSEIVTVEPGDVLVTGTPAGTGHGQNKRLDDGDLLVCQIEGIGTLTNPVRREGGA